MHEFAFTLPKGYVDAHQRVHRHGIMRLATVLDEIEPIGHPKTAQNDGYALILLMARVITELGDIRPLTPAIIENLYAVDMLYLEDLYLRLNAMEPLMMETDCPHCAQRMAIQVAPI